MNFVIRIVFLIIAVKVFISGFDLIINPQSNYYLRGICVTCQSELYAFLLGIVLVFVAGLFFYMAIKNKIML